MKNLLVSMGLCSVIVLSQIAYAETSVNLPGVNVKVGSDGSVKTDVGAANTGVSTTVSSDGSVTTGVKAANTGVSTNVGSDGNVTSGVNVPGAKISTDVKSDGSVNVNLGDAIKVDVAGTADAAVKAADLLEIEEAYIRAVPPGQPNSAAFMTINNPFNQAFALTAASSPVAATVELHTHTHNNGVMEMRKIDKIDIPADGEVELKPGGLHIMLIGLKQELKVGEDAKLTLTFADGSTKEVTAEIKEVTPPAGMQQHGGHHKGH